MGGAARSKSNRAAAAPVSEGICAFCGSPDQDETTVGKLYQLGKIVIHYYCALVSSGLSQRGDDEEGLFGFLFDDIVNELQRGKKLKCSYCGCYGATIGCCVAVCKKSFHLPCGRRRGALSVFYGNYKSFCTSHIKKQNIPESVLSKARERQARSRAKIKANNESAPECEEATCAICYESVAAWPCVETFWPPCCARDRWLHTLCLQRMALSAGIHYLKCPLCNDKDTFQVAAQEHGVFIPDRDAAWELENDAFAELYERPRECSAAECLCYRGREYDADEGDWELKMCVTCGSEAAHAGCLPAGRLVCERCGSVPVPPGDLDALERIPLVTAENEAPEYRPLMTHRLSIRRTKSAQNCKDVQKIFKERIVRIYKETDLDEDVDVESIDSLPTTSSGHDVILRRSSQSPRAVGQESDIGEAEKRDGDGEEMTPLEMLEKQLHDKITSSEDSTVRSTVERGIRRMRRPGPLGKKKETAWRILENIREIEISKRETPNDQPIDDDVIVVNEILGEDDLPSLRDDVPVAEENNVNDDSISKVKINVDTIDKEFNDPVTDVIGIERIVEENIVGNEDLVAKKFMKYKKSENNYRLPLNLNLKKRHHENGLEMLKFRYLSEVRPQNFQCKFNHKHDHRDYHKGKLQSAIDFAIESVFTNKNLVQNTVIENMKNGVRSEDMYEKAGEVTSNISQELEIISPMHNDVEIIENLNPLMKLQRGIDKVSEEFDKSKVVKKPDKGRNKITNLENIMLVPAKNPQNVLVSTNERPKTNQENMATGQNAVETIEIEDSASDVIIDNQIQNQLNSKTQDKIPETNQNHSKVSTNRNKKKKKLKNNLFQIRFAIHTPREEELVDSSDNKQSTCDSSDLTSLSTDEQFNDSEKYCKLKDMKSKLSSANIDTESSNGDSEYTIHVENQLIGELTSNSSENSHRDQIKNDLRRIKNRRKKNAIKIKQKPEVKDKKAMKIKIRDKFENNAKKRKNRNGFEEVAKKRKKRDEFEEVAKKRKIRDELNEVAKKGKNRDEFNSAKKRKIKDVPDVPKKRNIVNIEVAIPVRNHNNCTHEKQDVKINRNYAENGFISVLSNIDAFYLKSDEKKLSPSLKQSILSFTQARPVKIEENTPKITKRRKKFHKSPDGLKQTTLSSFFSQTSAAK